MPAQEASWQGLFEAAVSPKAASSIQMRILKKRGHPFLLLPPQARCAAACLDLYPAQTARARAGRAILRVMLRTSIPFGTEKNSLQISSDDPFIKFLASAAG